MQLQQRLRPSSGSPDKNNSLRKPTCCSRAISPGNNLVGAAFRARSSLLFRGGGCGLEL
jgi:hypothetical protein